MHAPPWSDKRATELSRFDTGQVELLSGRVTLGRSFVIAKELLHDGRDNESNDRIIPRIETSKSIIHGMLSKQLLRMRCPPPVEGSMYSGAGESGALVQTSLALSLWRHVECTSAALTGGERAGPPPPRTIHGGMLGDPGNAPGSRAYHYRPSAKLARGCSTQAHYTPSLSLAPS
ncbi:hypothetical protein ACJJTC_011091 [Scirpophaga incertulas]